MQQSFLETLFDTKLVNEFHAFHSLLHQSPPVDYILSQINPVHIVTPCFFTMQYLCPSLLSGLISPVILIKMSHVFLIAPMRAPPISS
jgi:hypothetical protein